MTLTLEATMTREEGAAMLILDLRHLSRMGQFVVVFFCVAYGGHLRHWTN